jgi:hypothetical protein
VGGAGPGSDPPFGLGTVTYNVPKDWDLATLLRILPEAGIHAVEFRTTHAHGVEPTLSAAERAEVKRRCADAGMRQLSLGSICEFHSPDPAVVQQHVATCAEFVRLAHDIGALGVKVRPNGLPKEVPVERTLEQIGRALRQCGAVRRRSRRGDLARGARRRDAGAGQHARDHGRVRTPERRHQLEQQSDRRAGRIGAAAFDLLKPFLMTVHINDLESGYPYRELFGLLREAKFRRYTLIEVATPVPASDSGLEFYTAYYRRRWRELARG